jgi:hypothetical protein
MTFKMVLFAFRLDLFSVTVSYHENWVEIHNELKISLGIQTLDKKNAQKLGQMVFCTPDYRNEGGFGIKTREKLRGSEPEVTPSIESCMDPCYLNYLYRYSSETCFPYASSCSQGLEFNCDFTSMVRNKKNDAGR